MDNEIEWCIFQVGKDIYVSTVSVFRCLFNATAVVFFYCKFNHIINLYSSLDLLEMKSRDVFPFKSQPTSLVAVK